jgi:hypothetical protein
MGSNKKTVQSKAECRVSLEGDLHRSAKRLEELEKQQRDGDFSIELAREINIKRYHIEVVENRLNGEFEAEYRHESILQVPKNYQK